MVSDCSIKIISIFLLLEVEMEEKGRRVACAIVPCSGSVFNLFLMKGASWKYPKEKNIRLINIQLFMIVCFVVKMCISKGSYII